MEIESQIAMILISAGMWFFLAGGSWWNNIFRTYVIGVHKWLRDKVLPQLQNNEAWQEEANELNKNVIPQVDEYINNSFRFIFPLFAVLAINSALLILAVGGAYIHGVNFLVAISNAACAVGFLELRKRYFVTKAFAEAYKTLLHAEEIYNEHNDGTLE